MEDDGASFGVKKVGQERKLSEREHLSRPSSICVSPRMIYGCRLLLLLPPSSTIDGVFALVLCIGGICRFYYYFTLYTHSNEELLRTNKLLCHCASVQLIFISGPGRLLVSTLS